jgi:hypothetical protein
MKWINIEDETPKNRGFYIVCAKHREGVPPLICLNPFDYPGHEGEFSEHKVITQWMPLPEPPK